MQITWMCCSYLYATFMYTSPSLIVPYSPVDFKHWGCNYVCAVSIDLELCLWPPDGYKSKIHSPLRSVYISTNLRELSESFEAKILENIHQL